MSIQSFAKDLHRFGMSTIVSGNKIEIDFEDINFYIEVDSEWEKIITKVYKAKQFELNSSSKFLVSNNKIEFQIFGLSASYIFKPNHLFTENLGNDEVSLNVMSKEYQLFIFRSDEYSFERPLKKIKRRNLFRNERIGKPKPGLMVKIEDFFINFNTISYETKSKLSRDEIIEVGRKKCKSCLFKLAVTQNECWELREIIKVKGFHIPINDDDEKDMKIPNINYNDDLVSFYKVAKSSLFSTQSFLSYYHVLEYNFLKVSDEELYNKTKSIINSTSFNSSYENVNKLLSVLKKQEKKNSDETMMLKDVLNKYLDEQELIDFIFEIEKNTNDKVFSKPKDEVFGEKLPIKLELGHTISNTATVIKHIRNSLVHSSDRFKREECVIPFSESETDVVKYLPIVRFLAEKIIFAYGN